MKMRGFGESGRAAGGRWPTRGRRTAAAPARPGRASEPAGRPPPLRRPRGGSARCAHARTHARPGRRPAPRRSRRAPGRTAPDTTGRGRTPAVRPAEAWRLRGRDRLRERSDHTAWPGGSARPAPAARASAGAADGRPGPQLPPGSTGPSGRGDCRTERGPAPRSGRLDIRRMTARQAREKGTTRRPVRLRAAPGEGTESNSVNGRTVRDRCPVDSHWICQSAHDAPPPGVPLCAPPPAVPRRALRRRPTTARRWPCASPTSPGRTEVRPSADTVRHDRIAALATSGIADSATSGAPVRSLRALAGLCRIRRQRTVMAVDEQCGFPARPGTQLAHQTRHMSPHRAFGDIELAGK